MTAIADTAPYTPKTDEWGRILDMPADLRWQVPKLTNAELDRSREQFLDTGEEHLVAIVDAENARRGRNYGDPSRH